MRGLKFCRIFIVMFLFVLYLSGGEYPRLLFFCKGDTIGDMFGRRLAGVGDQNGDGYDDVMIGAGTKSAGTRRIMLYLGGDPMDTEPDYVWEGGLGVHPVDDITGDGVIDFIIEYIPGDPREVPEIIEVYRGGYPYDDGPFLRFQWDHGDRYFSAHPVGDVDGDGYNDVVLSEYDPDEGYVAFYKGGPDMDTIPERVWVGESETTELRYVNRCPVDLNHDGYYDLILRKGRSYMPGQPLRFVYEIYYGGETLSSVPDTVIKLGYDEYYHFLSYYDDFNGDGYPEIITCGIDSMWECDGSKYIIDGQNAFDFSDVYVHIPKLWGIVSEKRVPCGDVNGDGYRDLLLGSNLSYVPFGVVRLFLGGPKMAKYADFVWIGGFNNLPEPYIGVGQALSWCGDVNGDGIDDIMFSAYDPNLNQRGHVYIYSGDTSWVNSSVGIEGEAEREERYSVLEIYPNPFNSRVVISYVLERALDVRIEIYDIRGRLVDRVERRDTAGSHSITWNGEKCSSGVYFVVLRAGGRKEIKKVVLLK